MRAATVALVMLGLLAAPAAADHGDSNLSWPALLPAQDVGEEVRPRPVENCRRASIRCIDRLIRRLRRQWVPLDRRCDHRALFSRAYLLITKLLRSDLARPKPRWFRDRRYMIYVITTFSNRYFRFFAAYRRGDPVPAAWRIAYDAAMHGDANGGQDILLASNAHTQRDLPYVYAEQGVATPYGDSRKPDHDGVNEVNARVFDRLQDEFARRYDPFFDWVDLKPLPLDELGVQEMVKGWREGAWRNAERLLAARSARERREVEQSIELNARLWAHAIADRQMPGHRAVRDAHCRRARAR